MIIKLTGFTPLALTKSVNILKLEALFMRLSKERFLPTLLTGDDFSDVQEINPSLESGYLINEIDKEINHLEESVKKWKPFLKSNHMDHFTRTHGSVFFGSADDSINLGVIFDDWATIPCGSEKRIGNMVDFQITFNELDENNTAWLLNFCSIFFSDSFFDYGLCCSSDEYESKNIDRSDGGMRAVGLDVSRYLPGFYWGNYFGNILCRKNTKLERDIDGFTSLKLTRGMFVSSALPPWKWMTEEYKRLELKAVMSIGEDLFFNKLANN